MEGSAYKKGTNNNKRKFSNWTNPLRTIASPRLPQLFRRNARPSTPDSPSPDAQDRRSVAIVDRQAWRWSEVGIYIFLMIATSVVAYFIGVAKVKGYAEKYGVYGNDYNEEEIAGIPAAIAAALIMMFFSEKLHGIAEFVQRRLVSGKYAPTIVAPADDNSDDEDPSLTHSTPVDTTLTYTSEQIFDVQVERDSEEDNDDVLEEVPIAEDDEKADKGTSIAGGAISSENSEMEVDEVGEQVGVRASGDLAEDQTEDLTEKQPLVHDNPKRRGVGTITSVSSPITVKQAMTITVHSVIPWMEKARKILKAAGTVTSCLVFPFGLGNGFISMYYPLYLNSLPIGGEIDHGQVFRHYCLFMTGVTLLLANQVSDAQFANNTIWQTFTGRKVNVVGISKEVTRNKENIEDKANQEAAAQIKISPT